MLTIGATPVLMTIISKLDLKPVMEVLKGLDIFNDAENKADALKQLHGDEMATLIAELFSALAPQLGNIAEDIPKFVAAYKGVSTENAEKLDLADVVGEIYSDEGIRTFFTRALRKKAEQTA